MPDTVAAPPRTRPRYYDVKVALHDLARSLGAGAPLPPERQLADDLGTSRTTLRKTLAELAAEGVLRRTQGSGNYVAPPKIVHVRQLTSLTDDLKDVGLRAGSRVLALERVAATPAVADHLGVAPGEKVHRLTRLRLVDDEPIAIEVAHLPGRLDHFARRLGEHGSLYATLRDCYSRTVASVEDTVETALTTPEEADLLHVAPGQPLLLLHRTARDPGGTVIEWTRSVYRGDRFKFVAKT